MAKTFTQSENRYIEVMEKPDVKDSASGFFISIDFFMVDPLCFTL